jgi:pyruvate formate lyase activating enzyme
MFNKDKCSGCGCCISVCSKGARIIGDNSVVIVDPQKCESCGSCVAVCSFNACEMSGRAYSVEELFAEILKDIVFYKESGGGVTLSGGEPTSSISFLVPLLEKCQENKIHVTLDTCGFISWKKLKTIIDSVDLFLYDIKLIDTKKHFQWTGVKNDTILNNAKNLADLGKEMIIRVPLIPGVNDDETEFGRIVKFAVNLKSVDTLHIMPFHQLGASKYDLINAPYHFKTTDDDNQRCVEKCKKIAEENGLKVDIGGSDLKPKEKTPNKSESKFFLYNY